MIVLNLMFGFSSFVGADYQTLQRIRKIFKQGSEAIYKGNEIGLNFVYRSFFADLGWC